ncbi:hypothetical protein [Sphingomonas sp. PR090111-T3T-6A]|uniref:hypothetical protein n=1 Tax=Sphingomonas sp. PR090111-T3T-6A TaxID=685778 RepID=UPI000374CDD0|nr:hypothetical protein [Sphingomonas sp. PR090111-T3T-6A]
MQILKLSALSLAAIAMTAVAVSPAAARPYGHRPHKVCKIERHHGHRVQVCHIVR